MVSSGSDIILLPKLKGDVGMEILILGPVKGAVERFTGLVEVSQPDIVVTIGPHNFKEPVRISKTWFYCRGEGDSLDVLSKSSGTDFLSRLFRTKEGLTFSGISGVYNPSTAKFTRAEWVKIKGKIGKSKLNAIFREDVEALVELFRRSGLRRLDFLVIADSPEKPIFREVLEVTKPRYLFYPSSKYRKEKVGDTVYVGLEDAVSPKGKYIFRFDRIDSQ